MAERRPRTPRSYFGLSPTPQPGLQEPPLSPRMSQRFGDAGLDAFLPYVNPWETVARAQDYRAAENQFEVQDAEERFIQRLQKDPASATTGLQKFLAEDPRLIASPMFRAYAVTQDRLSREQKPKTDPYALDAAEAGKPFLDQYNKDIASGVPQLDAFAAHRSRLAEAKKKSPEDERLTLSGTPKEEFDTLMAEYNNALDAEPTPEQKLAFMTPGKREYTKEEWSEAYPKAKAALKQEAERKLERFQQVYGDFYKLPGVSRKTASPTSSPAEIPTSTGAPQAALQATTAPNAAVVEHVQETVVEEPTKEILSISERKQPAKTTPQEEERLKTQVQDFWNRSWTSAKGEIGKALEKRKGLEKLADDPELLQSLFRSIQKGEAVLPQDIGLPKPEGGLRPENPADLLAQVIGKDPDAIATFQLKEGGKKLELRDSDGKKTWRQVIQALADESLQGTQGQKTVQPPAAFVTVTSQSDYESLPSGSIYRDSAGVTRRKK